MTIRAPASLPPFYWTPGAGDPPPKAPADAIGHDGATHLIVDASGAVRTTIAAGVPSRFVNSSIGQFLDFLDVFRTEWLRRPNLADQDAAGQVLVLRKQFRQNDATALTDDESWWSVILEQMRDDRL